MRVVILATCTLVLGACGGSSGEEQASTCTVTFSGAISGTSSCTAALGYSASNGKTSFALSGASSPLYTSFAAGIEVAAGEPSTGTWDVNTVSKAATTVVTGQSTTWLQSAHSSSTPDTGTFSLTISSTGNLITGSNGDKASLDSHGTLDATLPAVVPTGSTGTVTVHATF